MRCELCSSEMWSDDDLHWWWCYNPKCSLHYGNNEKTNEYFVEVHEKDQRMRERALEDGKDWFEHERYY